MEGHEEEMIRHDSSCSLQVTGDKGFVEQNCKSR